MIPRDDLDKSYYATMALTLIGASSMCFLTYKMYYNEDTSKDYVIGAAGVLVCGVSAHLQKIYRAEHVNRDFIDWVYNP